MNQLSRLMLLSVFTPGLFGTIGTCQAPEHFRQWPATE